MRPKCKKIAAEQAATFITKVEDNGLEHTANSPGNQEVFETSVLNPTRADCQSLETVFLMLSKLDSEQLKTLATIAKQFAPHSTKERNAEPAKIQ